MFREGDRGADPKVLRDKTEVDWGLNDFDNLKKMIFTRQYRIPRGSQIEAGEKEEDHDNGREQHDFQKQNGRGEKVAKRSG